MATPRVCIVRIPAPVPAPWPQRSKRGEKFSSQKIPRNPLKNLDSDEILRDLRNINDLSER